MSEKEKNGNPGGILGKICGRVWAREKPRLIPLAYETANDLKRPDRAVSVKSRVRSWLRMNAGGVPNTCKSNGASALMLEMLASKESCKCLVADG